MLQAGTAVGIPLSLPPGPDPSPLGQAPGGDTGAARKFWLQESLRSQIPRKNGWPGEGAGPFPGG